MYKVDSSITDLTSFAKHIGCTSGTIRLFNPWLLGESLHNAAKKVYEIRVPKDLKADYSGYIKDLLAEEGNLKKYSEKPEALQLVDTDTLGTVRKNVYYVVKVEEPLKNLANFLKLKEEDLRKWNNIPAEQLNVAAGQTLVLQYQVKE